MILHGFIEVAKLNEIPVGKMKHVELDGKEILVANIGGKCYAMNDRCDHMNALLSMGNLTGNTVTCPWHSAKFDVTTGKKLTEPNLNPQQLAPQQLEPLPQTWQKFFEIVGQLMARIKTYDQTAYETAIDGDRLKIGV